MKTKKDVKQEKAQSLVEFAGALVVLVIILAGVVDLGRAIFTLFAMQDAAEEGIVFGTSFPTHCDQIRERIQYNLANEILPDDITVWVTIENNAGVQQSCDSIPVNNVYAGKEMQIEVTQTFNITMPLIGAFVGQTILLKATANGIILRPQPPDY
mgnify:FL=1